MLNNINYNPDVLSCLANLSNDEVFTPPEIANKMLDTLPPELFRSKDTKFLDPFTKSGVFLREIAKRLIEGLAEEIPNLEERVQHIMQHQIYGIGITELTALLARRTLYCAKKTSEVYSVAQFFEKEEGNIHFSRVEHTWQNGRCEYCGASQDLYDRDDMMETHAYHFIHNENPYENMKFDVIIGNPPYQISDGSGKGAGATPLYHFFIQKAIKMQPHYLVMIVPSRWFAGGRGLDNFREQMLKDQRIKEIHDIPTSSEVFPGVSIEGGINYFLWQSDYKGDCLIKTYEEGKVISEMKRPLMESEADIFIRYNSAVSIFRKVKNFKEKEFKEIVSSAKPFDLRTFFKGKSTPYRNSDNLKLYQNGGIGYIKRDEVSKNEHWISEHKVLISYAYGVGKTKPFKVLNKPFYAEPNTVCTETYLVIGPFKDKQKCENVISYINTKFFRFLVFLIKNTQHGTQKVYQFVPQQDFSKPWTDEELYQKYGLTEEEINYIESMIRPME
ncbi:Eco57I restriction-modification methylase domain-containing protein [Riemerella anatipestifer]|nr:Eco57I restriction-modification methylase domain-containing protein [Riemerella anatipestifer]